MPAILGALLLLPAVLSATEQADTAQQQRLLTVAVLYESLQDWEKAEIQFLAAAQGPSDELRAKALAGIQRVRTRAAGRDHSSTLQLGTFYEGREMWAEAEKYYLAAAQSGSEEVQRFALEGLKRVRDQIPWNRFSEKLKPRLNIFNELLTQGLQLVGILALLLLLGITIRGVLEIRRRIEVLPFVANNEEASPLITYWLGHSQAMVQARGTPSVQTSTSSSLPYLHLPGLTTDVPDLGELSVVGMKVPVGELLKRLGRPRVRISGGWITDTARGRAFAELRRRRGFSRYEPYALIRRDIPVNQRDQELELFAYQILIKAAECYVS